MLVLEYQGRTCPAARITRRMTRIRRLHIQCRQLAPASWTPPRRQWQRVGEWSNNPGRAIGHHVLVVYCEACGHTGHTDPERYRSGQRFKRVGNAERSRAQFGSPGEKGIRLPMWCRSRLPADNQKKLWIDEPRLIGQCRSDCIF